MLTEDLAREVAFPPTIPALPAGLHRSAYQSYISGTGTAGADDTAQTVKSIVLPAYTLRKAGDRLRVTAYFEANGVVAIDATLDLNTVPIADATITSTDISQLEVWLHFIDSTHANIIENESGALGSLTAINVAGFDWAADQALIFTQSAVVAQHLTVFALIVDLFPRGY